MTLKRRSALTTSQWSGGTTTELAIFPAGSSYAARDFDWRISTATVETAESEFTHLPGYHRLLMVLEGGLQLLHDTGAEQLYTRLKPLEHCHFDGDWKTTGFGTVRDFNVMFRYGKTATLEVKTESFTLQNAGTTVLYCLNGAAVIHEQTLQAGDVYELDQPDESTVTPVGHMQLIVVQIA